jgi:plastocyanin
MLRYLLQSSDTGVVRQLFADHLPLSLGELAAINDVFTRHLSEDVSNRLCDLFGDVSESAFEMLVVLYEQGLLHRADEAEQAGDMLANLLALALLCQQLPDGGNIEKPGPSSGTGLGAQARMVASVADPHTASISGTVTYAGYVPEMALLDMSADPVCAELNRENPGRREVLVLGDERRIANVLVQIKGGLPRGLPRRMDEPPDMVVEFDQSGCRFAPHVFALRVGQTLRILNPDGTLHNVHAYAKVNPEFNEAMPKFRTELEKVFLRAEPTPFAVTCDVHPWMRAWVAVLDHPYYGVTGSDGSFRISNLPAGTYELEIWHERLPTQTHVVSVGAGENIHLDAEMRVPSS